MNTVGIAKRVDKASCKSMDGSFVRSIMCRKGKSITRMYLHLSEQSTVLSGLVWEVLLSMCCLYWLMNKETALDL